MKKSISRLVALVALVVMAASALQIPASAESSYKSYVYDNESKFAYAAPEAASFKRVVDVKDIKDNNGKNVARLEEPSDIHTSYDNKIYITDPKTNRIVVLTSDYKYVTELKNFKSTVTEKDGTKRVVDDHFTEPNSVFVSRVDGSIYVCDYKGVNANNVPAEYAATLSADVVQGRIVQFDKNYNFVRSIYDVNSDVLKSEGTFTFQPTKVAVDSIGRIFVVSFGFNRGLIELDSNGEFVQCLGAPPATPDFFQKIRRMFATDAEKETLEKWTSTEYSNIDITDDDFIYGTIDAYEKTEDAMKTKFVQKINAKGNDVLILKELQPYGDYSEKLNKGTITGPSLICDVSSLPDGMYAILDKRRCRVFVYNSDGQNLFEFGAPPDKADNYISAYVDGTLELPVSMAWIGSTCYVLDSAKKTINVYNLTDYGNKIFAATKLHFENKYDEEGVLWEDILKLNNSSAAAKNSLGMVAYRKGDWDTAMSYFKQTYNQDGYSRAFKFSRKEGIEKHFGVGVAVIVGVIILLVVASKLYKKFVPPADEKKYRGQLGYAPTLMTHPLHGYWELAREGRGGLAAANTVLVLAMIVSLIQARFTGFQFDITAEKTNILAQFAKILGLVLLYTVCSWCVTALMSGEAGFKTIYISTCYALTPLIIFYPIAIVLSNVMAKDESNIYSLFLTVALIWALALIFFGTMRIHDYTIGKTILVTFITVCVMVLVVFLATLFAALVQQMIDFAVNISNELAARA